MKWLQIIDFFIGIFLINTHFTGGQNCQRITSDNEEEIVQRTSGYKLECPTEGPSYFLIEYIENLSCETTCNGSVNWNDFNIDETNELSYLEIITFKNCQLPPDNFTFDNIINELSENSSIRELNFFGSDLNNNNLKINDIKFNSEIFKNLKSLKMLKTKISVDNNELITIDENLFKEIKSIEFLNLNSNQLNELDNNSLKELKNLNSLSDNNFTNNGLPSNLLHNNKKLETFILNYNKQKLPSLPEYFFFNLTNIKRILLNNNGIEYLPNNLFLYAINLVYLNLKSNSLAIINQTMFVNCINLHTLDVSRNNVTTASNGSFLQSENSNAWNFSP